jgi:hypothetical protein
MTARTAALVLLVVALPATLATTVPDSRRNAGGAEGPGRPDTSPRVQDPGGGRVGEPGVPLLPDPVLPDTSASLEAHIRANVKAYATPEYRARKTQRREFQRAGYAGVLHDILALDAAGALLSYIRTRLQIEYSLPHNTIYFRDDPGKSWALPEDWTFPADPWAD